MSERYLQTKVANVTLRLPVYRDKKSTETLAAEVEAMVISMEADADRIDTQAFALLAAYEFARRLRELEDVHAAEEVALIKALDAAASALQRLADTSADED